jgi:hypothetical protein
VSIGYLTYSRYVCDIEEIYLAVNKLNKLVLRLGQATIISLLLVR